MMPMARPTVGMGDSMNALFPGTDRATHPREVHGLASKLQQRAADTRILKRLIFVVDDDPSVREALGAGLEERGFEVWKTSSGQMVLTMIKTRVPDAVVCDVYMPERSGFEVVKGLRSSMERPPPVVLLTGLEDPHDRERAFADGAAAYLTKPISLTSLVHCLYRVWNSEVH
jgi:CheY-like chemotaxis protein